MTTDDKTILVYTDGSARQCSSRRDGGEVFPGGFGIVLLCGDRRLEQYMHVREATINQMEISAIYAALMLVNPSFHIVVYTDSKYCINCITKWSVAWRKYGWSNVHGEPVVNRDVIEAILARMSYVVASGGSVTFKHVRGHSGVAENERADALAHRARVSGETLLRESIRIPGIDREESA